MASRSTEDRRKSFRRGHASELIAALYLVLRGHRILAMRYRTKAGEIDIIARRRNLIRFVEVKARARTEDAVFAVDVHTQNRIRNASLAWLARQSDGAELSYSYDIVAIRPWRWPVHLPDAY
jgi:putative endonuclease